MTNINSASDLRNLFQILSLVPAWIVDNKGEWLTYVIFSQLTLVRNLSGFYFPMGADGSVLREVRFRLDSVLRTYPEFQDVPPILLSHHRNMGDFCGVLQELGVPIIRQPAYPERVVYLNRKISLVALVNQENHLTLVHLSGRLPQLGDWYHLYSLEQRIHDHYPFAYHPEFGYLTASPKQRGGGMKIAIGLHIPGIILSGQLPSILRGLQALGVHGVILPQDKVDFGSHILVLQKSRILPGEEEKELHIITEWAKRIIDIEHAARQYLITYERYQVIDYIARAYALLRSVYDLGDVECSEYFSALLLGKFYNMLSSWEVQECEKVRLALRPFHLKWLLKERNLTMPENIFRAIQIRELFRRKKKRE